MHKTLQLVHETLTFKIRNGMAGPSRADSQRQVFNTIEFLHNDIKTCVTLQIRDRSHEYKSSITSLIVCNSSTCFPGFVVVLFQFFQVEVSSYTDKQRSASTWDRAFVNVSDRFPLVGTPSTFKRPSCTACCSHKKRTSTPQSLSRRHAPCSTATTKHANFAFYSVTPVAQHCLAVASRNAPRCSGRQVVHLESKAMLNDWHFEVKCEKHMRCDSRAARGVSARQGMEENLDMLTRTFLVATTSGTGRTCENDQCPDK